MTARHGTAPAQGSRALLVVLAFLLLSLAGCGSAAPSMVPDRDLAASTTQFRNQEGTSALRTGVTNNSHRTIQVGTATFRWPGFAWPAVRVSQVVPPGQTAAFDMEYGAAHCDRRPQRAASMLVGIDGSTRTLPLLVQDRDLLLRLWQRACGLQRLAQVASVRLAHGRLDGARYRTSIKVDRLSGSAPVRIVDVGGSVIIDMLAPARPRVLEDHDHSLRLPVTFRPSDRCDPHSLSQSQQTFLLSAYLRVGRAPVVRLILPLSARVQADLQQMIDRFCH
ncbi:hypothetical protein [Nocardioides terrisoli]|uniref:hypothetical protein n=1 Tax=Nocardioides terrisoli TaxID=3388267 RepID=UPI00287BC907|nr:hypothetical protein [Nocardioides marmorisolisilvae]